MKQKKNSEQVYNSKKSCGSLCNVKQPCTLLHWRNMHLIVLFCAQKVIKPLQSMIVTVPEGDREALSGSGLVPLPTASSALIEEHLV